MTKKCGLGLLLLALPWTASAHDAQLIIANSAKAMGVQNLDAVGSYMYSGSGAIFAFGEARKPSPPWPKSGLSSYRRVIDFDAGGSLELIARTQDRNGSIEAKDHTEIRRLLFREHYGVEGKQYQIWISPLAFLKGAVKADATVRPVTIAGKQYIAVSYAYADNPAKYRVTGYINDQNLLERVEALVSDPLFGDMVVEGVYTDYKDFQHGLVFPSQIVEKQGGYPVLELAITGAVRNALTIAATPVIEPQVVQYNGDGPLKFREPYLGGPPPISVDEALYGDSVYYLRFRVEGDGKIEDYHSVVAEFNDYLVVIEAPLDEEHSIAAIKEIRTVFGSKPIRYVVNTHAHRDASGGLRTYAAQGAIIITQELNKPYFEKLFTLPRTVHPDQLAQTKKKVQIEGVAEKRVLTDGSHVIELYRVDNESSEGMLMAYMPREKMVIEADLYTVPAPDLVIDALGRPNPPPKAPVTRYAAAFANTLDRMKLDYRKILGLVGRATTKEELLEDVKKPAPK